MNKIILLLFIVAATNAWCQRDFVPPDDDLKEGYYEGKRNYVNVNSTGRLKLKSFIVRTPLSPSQTDRFEISFFVPPALSKKTLDIFFEDANDDYYMMPVDKAWDTGLRKFQWKKSILSENLKPTDLRGIIKGSHTLTEDTLIPVAFSVENGKKSFEWILKSDRDVTVVYSIIDPAKKKVHSGKIENHPKKAELKIEWPYTENTVPGLYVLRIAYLFTNGVAAEGIENFKFYVPENN